MCWYSSHNVIGMGGKLIKHYRVTVGKGVRQTFVNKENPLWLPSLVSQRYNMMVEGYYQVTVRKLVLLHVY